MFLVPIRKPQCFANAMSLSFLGGPVPPRRGERNPDILCEQASECNSHAAGVSGPRATLSRVQTFRELTARFLQFSNFRAATYALCSA